MIERRRLFLRRDFLSDIAQLLPCLSRKLLFHLRAYSQQTTQSGALAAEAKLACPFIPKWLLRRQFNQSWLFELVSAGKTTVFLANNGYSTPHNSLRGIVGRRSGRHCCRCASISHAWNESR